MNGASPIRFPIRRPRPPVALVLFLLAMGACGDRPGTADREAGRAAVRPADTLSSAAVTAPASGLSDLPAYPRAQEATELRRSMERAWEEAGEPSELFDDRLGEVILWTDDPWEDVRAFYRPRATRVLMDHEMEFPEVGRQKMLTGLIQLSDGSIVKFTATRPFFRYPDQERIDRTVIQMGRLIGGRSAVPSLLPGGRDSHSSAIGNHAD